MLKISGDDDQNEGFSFPIKHCEENGGGMLMDIFKSGVHLQVAPPPEDKRGKKRKAKIDATRKNNASRVHGGGRHEGEGNPELDDQGIHIWTERERRKKMRDMYDNLNALIPGLTSRADKASIIDGAVLYIQRLKLLVDDLERRKKDRGTKCNTSAKLTGCDPFKITNQNLAVEFQSGGQGGSTMNSLTGSSSNTITPTFPGPAPAVCFRTWNSPNVVISVCGIDAHISICYTNRTKGMLTGICFVLEKYKLDCVCAKVASENNRRTYMIHAHANVGSDQTPEILSHVEQVYKQAASEIMMFLGSFRDGVNPFEKNYPWDRCF